ncbi:metallophosphoesterase [Paraglaciecola aestuariivivens]
MIKIAQISDCHIFSDSDKCGYLQINPYQSLRLVLQHIKQQQPDLLIVTGDISGDASGESYQHFQTLLKQANLSCELYLLPGNHDDPSLMQACFPAHQLWINLPHIALGSRWHLHLLSTHDEITKGQLEKSSLINLNTYLTEHAEGFHLMAAHHHPIATGGWMDQHEWKNRDEFNALINQHANVKGVIYGHIHQANQKQVNECLYMSCPATCWQFDSQPEFSLGQPIAGYRMLTLLDSGKIESSTYYL